MGTVTNDLCTFCGKDKESIYHIFWRCNVAQSFWKQLQELLNENGSVQNIILNESIILFGITPKLKSDAMLHFIILLAKYFIYNCKFNNSHPTCNKFQIYLNTRYHIEKYIAYINVKTEYFDTVWAPYLNIINWID